MALTFFHLVKLGILSLIFLINFLGFSLLISGTSKSNKAHSFNTTFPTILDHIINNCVDLTSNSDDDYTPYADLKIELIPNKCYIVNAVIQTENHCDKIFKNICKNCLRYEQVVEQSMYLENIFYGNLCGDDNDFDSLHFRSGGHGSYQNQINQNFGLDPYEAREKRRRNRYNHPNCITTETFDYHQVWSEHYIYNKKRLNFEKFWKSYYFDNDLMDSSKNYFKVQDHKISISEEIFNLILEETSGNEYNLLDGEMYQESNNLGRGIASVSGLGRSIEIPIKRIKRDLGHQTMQTVNQNLLYTDWYSKNFTYFTQELGDSLGQYQQNLTDNTDFIYYDTKNNWNSKYNFTKPLLHPTDQIGTYRAKASCIGEINDIITILGMYTENNTFTGYKLEHFNHTFEISSEYLKQNLSLHEDLIKMDFHDHPDHEDLSKQSNAYPINFLYLQKGQLKEISVIWDYFENLADEKYSELIFEAGLVYVPGVVFTFLGISGFLVWLVVFVIFEKQCLRR